MGDVGSLYKIKETFVKSLWENVKRRKRKKYPIEEVVAKDINENTLYVCHIPSVERIYHVLDLNLVNGEQLAEEIYYIIQSLAENGICVDVGLIHPPILSPESAKVYVEFEPRVVEASDFLSEFFGTEVKPYERIGETVPYAERQRILEILRRLYKQYKKEYNISALSRPKKTLLP